VQIFQNLISAILVWALPVLLAVTWREAVRAHVAAYLGDRSALVFGRGSFNPIKHVDPLGTVLLPTAMLLFVGIPYGYARPIPVEPQNFHDRRRGLIMVLLAGTAASLVLAIMGALLLPMVNFLPDFLASWTLSNVNNFIRLNCILIVFNLLPIPPLDGGRLLGWVLPQDMARKYYRIEPFGVLLLAGAIVILPLFGDTIGLNLNLGERIILAPANWLYIGILNLTGLL